MNVLGRIFVSIVIIFSIIACSNIESEIQTYVEEENKKLPFEYGGELVLEKCEFDKVNVIYKYKLPEVSIAPDDIDALKTTLLSQEVLNDERFMQLLTMLADGGYGLVYEYSDYTNNSIAVTFTNEEIKTIL